MPAKAAPFLILATLTAALATVVYERGFGWRLGAAPAALEGEYFTEEAWIVGEIVRDVAEMSAYPTRWTSAARIAPASAEAGRYTVESGSLPDRVDLDLRRELWSPAAFAGVARAAMAPGSADVALPGGAGLTRAGSAIPAHPALVDLTPGALVAAASTISRSLAVSMRDAGAHEAAALTLGAFALRESAGRGADTRWAMNRMTAHLAMAHALSGGNAGVDGKLAEAVLYALANHQTRALAMVGRLTTPDGSRALEAWIRALRLRITEDWRTMPFPTRATRIEKYEYLRARRATVRTVRGTVELGRLGETPDAGWLRILQASSPGVPDGWRLTDALDREVEEIQDVHQRIHGRPLGSGLAAALDARPARLVGEHGPEVLPWGAWAAFAQRHLGMFIGQADAYYRRTLGSETAAEREKRRLRSELGALSMFPIAAIWWTKGPRGDEADTQFVDDAIDRAVTGPERVPAAAWSVIEAEAKLEPVRRGMPAARGWFLRPEPRSMYDAGARIRDSGHPRDLSDMAAMMRDAPYDFQLGSEYLATRYGHKPPFDEIVRVAGARMDYDLRALRLSLSRVADETRRLSLLRRACEVSAAECIPLGAAHAMKGRDDEAAASYERAFADPSLDPVTMSNASAWLVRFYHRGRRRDAALDLARRSAAAGSFQGLVTLASQYERLERWDEAEELYRRAADRHGDRSALLGFYYRATSLHKRSGLEAASRLEMAKMFPEGLRAAPRGVARPAYGVILSHDNDMIRSAGLRAGDLVVALEGWRIENVRQYSAVNAFYERDVMKLTAWRGKEFEVTLEAPGRQLGVELRTYPSEAWGEK